MKFLYPFAIYPNNYSNSSRVRSASTRLYTRLKNLSVAQLDISDYNKRYFGGHISGNDLLRAHITKYSYILEWALSGIDKNIDEIVFMDYGGGHGMLSLLAKEVGIGTVIHNDIYAVSCDDAKGIAEAVGLTADYYVPGDIDTILEFMSSNCIDCNVIANYDVIEHIYDIDDFLGKLHKLSSKPMSIFLASAANEINPRIKRLLMKQHVEFEYRDRPDKFGRKPTDATRAILNMREEIIANCAPSLSEKVVKQLAVLTRGLVERDIIDQVECYLTTGKLPNEPDHPTNTCDPFTGNWFEHLMDPYKLAETLNQTGLETKVMCGYYDSSASVLKRSVKLLLNAGIRVMGHSGLYLAPYYALFSRK